MTQVTIIFILILSIEIGLYFCICHTYKKLNTSIFLMAKILRNVLAFNKDYSKAFAKLAKCHNHLVTHVEVIDKVLRNNLEEKFEQSDLEDYYVKEIEIKTKGELE